MEIKKIAEIRNGFSEKFGIPRQSGLCDSVKSTIVFEPEYRIADAFRGLEGFSHIWIIWQFSESIREDWSPTVRPPRLGGNKRVGVFATRSPFRPNSLGLSCVKLDGIEYTDNLGPVIHISGADLMNGTPIYDIKPYLTFTDSHPEASSGFADDVKDYSLSVNIPDDLLLKVASDKRDSLIKVLSGDPRPSYIADGDREYTFSYANYEISFTVRDGIASVTNIEIKG